jgi:hypothetical protein
MTETSTDDPLTAEPPPEPEAGTVGADDLEAPPTGPPLDLVPPTPRSDQVVQTVITVVTVAVCVLITLLVLGPDNLVRDTTPAGGDMGAHVWGPAFLRDHLLDKFRLTGWTMDWYAGFPAYQFYMIIPSLLIAVLSWVLPYGVAFKLVAVSGLVTFPVACWFLGRSARLPFPIPALLSVGGMVFLFDRSFSIYGGNIASTMAGEFAFSISLTLGVFYLGVLIRGFDTGRYRAWAAVLLALTGLCHLLPFLFVLVCTVLYLIVRPGVGRIVYLATMVPVGLALTCFWTVPFFLRSGYLNDMGWERITSERYGNYLWSREKLDSQLLNAPDLRLVIVFAVIGLMLSLVFRRRLGVWFATMAVTFAVGFMTVPQGRVWNARLLPFYYLSLYLLAAVGVAELCRLAAALFARDPDRPIRGVLWVTPVLATAAVFFTLMMSLAALPGGTVEADGSFRWGIGPLSVSTRDRSFVESWAAWNFEGYEGLTPTETGDEQYRKSYPEYHDIVETMAGLGRDKGCGRALWEHEEAHDRYGTPMALMLLPFWTDGCIGSMEGLYFEASATTPYHFLQQDELSWTPSNAQRELPYDAGSPTRTEFDRGIRHMQMMGVKYYMAINENTQALAEGSSSLTRVAASGPWKVYEVGDAPLVQSLPNRPAVLTGQSLVGRPWQDTSVCWWVNPSDWNVVLTSDGPADWPRVTRTVHPDEDAAPAQKCQPSADWGWFDGGTGPPVTPQDDAGVRNVVTSEDGVSFDVDKIGVPVLVKVSYFPNWQVTGAQGPYRATPNFMVVVPESNHVELRYGWTGVDLAGLLLTLAGLAGLVWLVRAAAVEVAPPTRFWGRAERPDLYPSALRLLAASAPLPEVPVTAGPVVVDWIDQLGPGLRSESTLTLEDLAPSPFAGIDDAESGGPDAGAAPLGADGPPTGTDDVLPDAFGPDAGDGTDQ